MPAIAGLRGFRAPNRIRETGGASTAASVTDQVRTPSIAGIPADAMKAIVGTTQARHGARAGRRGFTWPAGTSGQQSMSRAM